MRSEGGTKDGASRHPPAPALACGVARGAGSRTGGERTHLDRARVVWRLANGHHGRRGAVWVGRGSLSVGLLGRVGMAEGASGW